MLVTRIDEILGDDAASHLQTGDAVVEAAAHLRPGKPTGGTQLASNEAPLFLKCQQDGLFDRPFLRCRKLAAPVVAEIRPPVAAYKPCLAGEEFAIDTVSLRDDWPFPLPKRPVPASVGIYNVATFIVRKFFGRKAPYSTVQKRQEPYLLNQVYQFRTRVYFHIS